MQSTALNIMDNGSSTQELNEFQKLWNKIEKFEQRNFNAKIKVDKLYKDYEETLLPHEKNYGNAHCSLIQHLLSFVPSSDLKKKDKLNLLEYLSNNINEMQEYGHIYNIDAVNKLHKKCDKYYQKFFSKERKQEVQFEYDNIKNMIHMMIGEEIELPEQEIKEAMISGDGTKLDLLMRKLRDDFIANKKQDDEWEDFEFNYHTDEYDESSKVTEIFKASSLNKMYKKIASIIHPDKEKCPLKKEERHKQMQLLVDAKTSADVFALVKMYREFVPNGEYLLDDTAMAHVESLLRMRIQKLNQEHRDAFNEQGLKSFVWKRYSDTSRKKSFQKMEDNFLEAKKHTIKMNRKIKQLTTAKKVKEFLIEAR